MDELNARWVPNANEIEQKRDGLDLRVMSLYE
jgi:hypothetical protein